MRLFSANCNGGLSDVQQHACSNILNENKTKTK